jgi:hypothetical protein
MGPAGIGKGSSEATRTGLATATGAGTGTGGAGATAAGAAVGAPHGSRRSDTHWPRGQRGRYGRHRRWNSGRGRGCGHRGRRGRRKEATSLHNRSCGLSRIWSRKIWSRIGSWAWWRRVARRGFRRHIGSAGAIDNVIDPHCRSRVCSPRRRIDHVGDRLLGASSDHVRQAHNKNQKTNDPHTR